MSDAQKQKENWQEQASLVSLLLATVPNGTSLILGDRERAALVTIIENLHVIV